MARRNGVSSFAPVCGVVVDVVVLSPACKAALPRATSSIAGGLADARANRGACAAVVGSSDRSLAAISQFVVVAVPTAGRAGSVADPCRAGNSRHSVRGTNIGGAAAALRIGLCVTLIGCGRRSEEHTSELQ